MITYNDLGCLICLVLYGLMFLQMAEPPKKKRRRGGTWHQDDSRGE